MTRLATLLLCLALAPASMAQEVIHYWNFNSGNTGTGGTQWPSPLSATAGSGVLEHEFADGTLQAFAGSTTNSVDGDPAGSSFSVQNGASAINNGRSFTLAVPTSGYENITISYATQRTNTGFTSQSITFSTDGITYTDVAVIEDIPGSFGLRTVSLNSVPVAADNPSLSLRITLDGGTSTSAAGNNRFDNIRVSGTPIGTNRTPFFTQVLASQDVAYDELFAFTYEADDPDGDALTFALIDGPATAALDPLTGEFSWTPSESDLGQAYGVTVAVSDGELSAQTSATLTVIEPVFGPPITDLFFSEYVEGSSNNKALEIYNGTGSTVDLSDYRVLLYFNGATNVGRTFNLSGILEDGDVYVIAHSSADEALTSRADLLAGGSWYNGDDAITLQRGDNVVDAIGRIGEQAIWGSGDITTQDHTLRRIADACIGRTDPFSAYNPADYFVGFPVDTFDGIGQHTARCEVLPDNQPPFFVSTLSDKLVASGYSIDFQFVADDPDGDDLVFQLIDAPEGATLDASTGQFQWTTDVAGIYPIRVAVDDSRESVVATAKVGVQGTICGELEGMALRECVREDYTPAQTLGYDTAARDLMYGYIDLVGGFVSGIYTGFSVAVADPATARQAMNAGGINAEHVWPQSRGAITEPARSDLHNLFPARSNVNSSRGNHPFTNLTVETTNTWWRLDQRYDDVPDGDLGLYSKTGSQLFEPRDYAKGAIARAILYFYTIYEAQSEELFMYVQKDPLTGWQEVYPAEGWEVRRSYLISQAQGNINPYILDETLARRMLVDVTLPEPIPIAEARTKDNGTTVTIEGVVTRAGGRFARLQDETAGLTIFQSSGAFRNAIANGDVAEGDLVRVIGSMATFNELRQVNPSLFEVISRGNELPDPVELTLAEVAEDGATYESMLISVRGLEVETDDETFAAARTYAVTDGTAEAGTVDFRTPSSGEGAIIGQAVPDGAFDFVGVLGRFLNTFQLQPINATDVRPVPVLTVTGSPAIMWPPNSKMRAYALTDFVSAISGGTGSISLDDVFVRRITSDEMPLGDAPDVVVGAECRTFDLRAARDGESDGRVYTIEFGVYDALGTLGTASAQVHVPANRGRNSAVVDSGVAYEVVPECNAADRLMNGASLEAAEAEALPTDFALDQNYPNPFNPTTTIQYALPEAVHVRVSVFNLLGQEVATLVDQVLQAGRHEVRWDAGQLSSGMYIYVIDAGSFRESRRMVLLK
jgi:hypothetical protein